MMCSSCGSRGTRVTRGVYRFAESGLKNVRLAGIELIRCRRCGNVDPILPKLTEIMKVLALAVIGKPGQLAGEEARFLRKFLNKPADEFAKLLGVDATTLSRWENNHQPIGPQSDRLIRCVALALADSRLGLKQRQRIDEIFRKIDTAAESEITVNSETLEYEYRPAA
jgi:DNA-binding transcriptional regulator YiaG